MEWLWAGLLILCAMDRRTRPLALLLGLKWSLNYGAAFSGAWLAVPLIDIALGSVGIWLSAHLADRRTPFLSSLFVVVPMVHAWHWLLWGAGVWVGVQYFWLMLGLFTAQVVILSGPGVKALVYGGIDRLAFAYRLGVAGLAPAPRQRRGRGSSRW